MSFRNRSNVFLQWPLACAKGYLASSTDKSTLFFNSLRTKNCFKGKVKRFLKMYLFPTSLFSRFLVYYLHGPHIFSSFSGLVGSGKQMGGGISVRWWLRQKYPSKFQLANCQISLFRYSTFVSDFFASVSNREQLLPLHFLATQSRIPSLAAECAISGRVQSSSSATIVRLAYVNRAKSIIALKITIGSGVGRVSSSSRLPDKCVFFFL